MSHKITYREKGQGPLLLLLHGYGGSPSHWEAISDQLSTQYRVITLNLSHIYMSTDKLFFTVQVHRLGQFIEENFAGEKINLAGLSFGGALTWGLASLRPEMIDKIILINPLVTDPIRNFLPKELRFFFSLPMNLKSIYFMLSTPIGQGFLRRSAQIFRDERSEGTLALERIKGRKLLFVAHLIHHFSWILRSENWGLWNEKLKLFTGKSLLIYDQNDLLFDKVAYTKFAQHMNCKEIRVLEGAGHLAIKSQPQNICVLIASFMESGKAEGQTQLPVADKAS